MKEILERTMGEVEDINTAWDYVDPMEILKTLKKSYGLGNKNKIALGSIYINLYSVQQIATLTGIAPGTIRAWKRTNKPPNYEHKEIIQRLIGIKREDWYKIIKIR